MLRDGSWLRRAGDANRAARRLGDGLQALGHELPIPVEANAVFIRLSKEADESLRQSGHVYYQFGDPGRRLFRLMCSFDTTDAHIDAFLADAKALVAR